MSNKLNFLNKAKQSNQPKTVVTNKRYSLIEDIAVNLIAILVLLAFGYIAVMSFFQTSVIDPTQYANETILYQADLIALNLFFTALFVFVLFRLKKYYDFFAKVNIKYMEIGIAVYAIVLGLIWIFSVMSAPTTDSQNLFEAATKSAVGDYSFLKNGSDFYNNAYFSGYSYFNFYPFQLGYVLVSEIVYRIFGTASSMPMQVINVLCLGAAYFGIARITKLLFKRRSVEFIAILLLAGCIQPILFCTFAYGNIIGMCCAIWASCFLIKYFQTENCFSLLPCGLLLVLSVFVKYNNMIYVIAFMMMLTVHTIKKKKWQSIAFALAICIASLGSIQLVIMSYEKRGDVELSDGISQVLYLDLGLSESSMAPGWYSSVAKDTYTANMLDSEASKAQGWQSVNSKLDNFSKNLGYTIDFFSKKILSQWNEPTYESIWVSKVREHTNALNGIATSVYDKSLGQLLELHFNFYMQILFSLFAIGICILIIKKQTNIQTVLLPLVLLGGFGYHLLFEAKSQYILTYIILMIPTAAYSLNSILNGKYTKLKKLIGEIEYIPEK